MPISLESSQNRMEGEFYLKNHSKKTPKQSKKFDSDSLKISQGQILTKTALGICLFLTLVDSVESTKKILPDNLPSPQNTFIKTSFPDYKIPPLKDLIIASEKGDISVVKATIRAGVNVNKKNAHGEVALRFAAENGYTEVVNELIKAGADVNASNNNGATALKYAAEKGHLKIVEDLIKAGADVNASNNKGSTSLQVAAEKGHLEIVKVLVEAGADINASNNNEGTALTYAAENGHLNIVKAFIENGADVKKMKNDGTTALKYAAQNGHIEVVNELIKAGTNVDVIDKNGVTSLQVATIKGHLEVVKALIETGASVNQKNEFGELALRYAAEKGHTEIVNELIKAGADVNASNKDGATSLQVAAEKGYLEIVKVLVEAGAEIGHKNKFGFNAEYYASKDGRTEVVEFLTEKERLIDEEAREIKICPVDNRYDKFPLEQNAQPAEPALPQQIQQPVQPEEPSSQQPVQPAEPALSQQIQQPVQPEELVQSAQTYDYALALTATSLVMLGGVGVLLLPQIQQPVAQNPNEEEMILKASHLLDPINLYLDKLPLFTLEEIKPLEWKIEDNKFVLELEHQPEDLKREIQELFNRNFGENIESITQENENKSIITFNPAFTTRVRESSEKVDLNFIALQNIKDQLGLLCDRKNQEFEEKYGEFFMGLDFIEENKVISIGQKHFINAEDSNFKELMHFNLLNNFGLLILDDSLKNQLPLSVSGNGKISYHEDFYGEDDDPEIIRKYNKRTEENEAGESRDSIHNGVRIGERFVDRADPIAGENKIKYFVRFPEKSSDFALACTTTNREIQFFEANTNNQFEIQALRPINREDAVILFDRIRARQAPAPVIENGAQLNQFQVQAQVQNQQ